MNHSVTIKSITVEKLFGLYDYKLVASTDNENKLLILYGDNGCGKTTILKLTYHLLATQRRRGHKTFIVQTSFKSVVVELSNNITIIAHREKDITGAYWLTIKKGNKTKGKLFCEPDEDNIVTTKSAEEEKRFNEFDNYIASIGLALYFLSDDRQIHFDTPMSDDMPHERYYSEEYSAGKRVVRLRREEPSLESIAIALLQNSINRANNWFRTQIMNASSIGESSVITIYSELIDRIAHLPRLKTESDIISKIKSIEKRNKKFLEFGLMPKFDAKKVIASIKKAPQQNIDAIENILFLYAESIDAKLDALDEIKGTIETLLETINKLFFTHKSIYFHSPEGFSIKTDDGKELLPSMFSSGERHLLLLFLNAVTTGINPSIFIIDEPELSLNIKWQRQLIKSLLACVKNRPIQYVFATHSMEILSPFKENVVKLGTA